jgi:hypothetical protein
MSSNGAGRAIRVSLAHKPVAFFYVEHLLKDRPAGVGVGECHEFVTELTSDSLVLRTGVLMASCGSA